MITYGCRKYGLTWNFELHENTQILWQGKRPDYLIIPRKDLITLYRKLGSLDAVHQWAGQRLHKGSFSTLEQKPTFSSLFS